MDELRDRIMNECRIVGKNTSCRDRKGIYQRNVQLTIKLSFRYFHALSLFFGVPPVTNTPVHPTKFANRFSDLERK